MCSNKFPSDSVRFSLHVRIPITTRKFTLMKQIILSMFCSILSNAPTTGFNPKFNWLGLDTRDWLSDETLSLERWAGLWTQCGQGWYEIHSD
jgi:hypothetical protein